MNRTRGTCVICHKHRSLKSGRWCMACESTSLDVPDGESVTRLRPELWVKGPHGVRVYVGFCGVAS